jgi:hypothetical protein
VRAVRRRAQRIGGPRCGGDFLLHALTGYDRPRLLALCARAGTFALPDA